MPTDQENYLKEIGVLDERFKIVENGFNSDVFFRYDLSVVREVLSEIREKGFDVLYSTIKKGKYETKFFEEKKKVLSQLVMSWEENLKLDTGYHKKRIEWEEGEIRRRVSNAVAGDHRFDGGVVSLMMPVDVGDGIGWDTFPIYAEDKYEREFKREVQGKLIERKINRDLINHL